MQAIARILSISAISFFLGGCGESAPDELAGPWDIVFLDSKTGEPSGVKIRQHNYVVAFAMSADEKAVVTSCRKELPDPEDRNRKPSEKNPIFTGVLRVFDAQSGELLAEREDHNTLHSLIWVPPQGKQFLTSTGEYPITNMLSRTRFLLWDYSSREIRQIARFELAPRSNVTVAFADDGQSVVMCGDMHDLELDKENITRADLADSTAIWAVRKWDIGGGKPGSTRQVGLGMTATRDVEQMVARAVISADGSRMITWPPHSNRKPIPDYQLWDLRLLEPIGNSVVLKKGQAPVLINQNGSRVLTTVPSEGPLISYQILDAESGEPLSPPVTGLRSLQAKFAGDTKSVLAQTYQEPDSWSLHLYSPAGEDVWTSGPYANGRFMASVSQLNKRVAYAVFPPRRSSKKE